MPLTPQDVSNKVFTTVRLREGYDMGEVDQFLDEVEAELSRLIAENTELRGAAREAGVEVPAPTLPAAREAAEAAEERPAERPAEEPAEKPAPPAAGPRPAAETLQVTTTADASTAAARLLEIATRNAEELESSARADAEEIVSRARREAEELEAEARQRSQRLDGETEQRRTELMSGLEREKAELDTEVDNLRAFEREYRSRLRSYFQQQLEALDSTDSIGGEDVPGRVRTLLPDEDDDDTQ